MAPGEIALLSFWSIAEGIFVDDQELFDLFRTPSKPAHKPNANGGLYYLRRLVKRIDIIAGIAVGGR